MAACLGSSALLLGALPARSRALLGLYGSGQFETFAKRLFLPPALFANAHLLLNKLRFAAELKNKK